MQCTNIFTLQLGIGKGKLDIKLRYRWIAWHATILNVSSCISKVGQPGEDDDDDDDNDEENRATQKEPMPAPNKLHAQILVV